MDGVEDPVGVGDDAPHRAVPVVHELLGDTALEEREAGVEEAARVGQFALCVGTMGLAGARGAPIEGRLICSSEIPAASKIDCACSSRP